MLNFPDKIKVGFVERPGTYTGKLAFVTWIDDKGILRKERSWDGWRDKDIPAKEYDNVPHTGDDIIHDFNLRAQKLKDIQRLRKLMDARRNLEELVSTKGKRKPALDSLLNNLEDLL